MCIAEKKFDYAIQVYAHAICYGVDIVIVFYIFKELMDFCALFDQFKDFFLLRLHKKLLCL